MLTDLDTPALILDAQKVKANCDHLRTRLQSMGVSLRPHVKTAKSLEVVRMAHGGGTGPITVSTLKEAEFFFSHGFKDILYAVGIAPNKFARAAALKRAGCTLSVVLDGVQAAKAFKEFCSAESLAIPALIEIDTDDHRAGVKPDAPELTDIGAILGSQLGGVMTHCGNSYISKSTDEIRGWAKTEREGIVHSSGRLRAAGHAAPVASVGSTPTAMFGETFAGLTEVRAGVYVFHDLVMAGLGVCRTDEIAMSVLASVIGHQAQKGWIITDAGWMALSRDRGTAKQAVDQGYGLVCDVDGRALGDLVVIDANQEHGVIARRGGLPAKLEDFPVGKMVRVLPNHACATGAQHGAYQVVNGSTAVAATWERFNGW
ncbi:alanine racemase [Usitatibacter palustris]|uniref:D-threo-3-hydroxyaspartate dehydratase n=1 Tax=Usitatibacter palustris TaxID=2732487 RepID=A0A6M4H9F2_9PROT|nr:alanine racemase [Usitatibacter palustris]QJR16220.1 D-threo-3-hydroxyaspartate dehydratase [Usitatibacter palustris]